MSLSLVLRHRGALTAVGPVLGGYLTQWTWRAIFWVNIPVALIALALTAVSKPATVHRAARLDYRGLVLIASGVALSVFGFQQSSIWGWANPGTTICVVAGVALLVAFYLVELRSPSPLVQVRIFRIRAFLVENLVLGIAMLTFIPVFFFASGQLRSRVVSSLLSQGLSRPLALREAAGIAQDQGQSASVTAIPGYVRLDFAYASRTVFFLMAGAMAVAAIVALFGLRSGLQDAPPADVEATPEVSTRPPEPAVLCDSAKGACCVDQTTEPPCKNWSHSAPLLRNAYD